MVNRFAWHAEGLVENQLNAFFINALLEMRSSLILQDEHESYVCVTSLPHIWKINRDISPSDETVFGNLIAAKLNFARKKAVQFSEPVCLEISPTPDAHFEFRVLSILTPAQQQQFITVIVDRSEERKKQAAMNALLREINHRSKNLLAIIQGIASHTARHTTTIAGFFEKFRGRLESIARSQDLVTDSDWQGARISDLLAQQVAWGLGDSSSAVTFSGENVLLSPNAALYIGLALHELMAGAVEHRDRMVSGPPIRVVSSMFSIDGTEMIELRWLEPGDAKLLSTLPETGHNRPASSILERVVPSALSGTGAYQKTIDHVVYSLVFPRGDRD